MSTKIAPRLKNLITTVRHDPKPGPSAQSLAKLFDTFVAESKQHNIGQKPWQVLATGTFFSMNSPSSLKHLTGYLSNNQPILDRSEAVARLALLRESGLKTVSFIGIAKVINNLGVLTSTFDPDLAKDLPKEPRRRILTENQLQTVDKDGNSLWSSIYVPFDQKLIAKLGSYHPDLPVHIISSHYGPLLSDPAEPKDYPGPVGRILTSCLAVASLRGLNGVGPQVLSHIFGLKKAGEEDIDPVNDEGLGENWKWLTQDEGLEWTLTVVDRLIAQIEAAAINAPSAKL